MAIPRGITRDDVERAIRDYEAGVQHPYRASSGYDLVLDAGRRLPPKAIVGLAARRLNGGRPLHPVRDFSGGQGRYAANRVLTGLGYAVLPKGAAPEGGSAARSIADEMRPSPREVERWLQLNPWWPLDAPPRRLYGKPMDLDHLASELTRHAGNGFRKVRLRFANRGRREPGTEATADYIMKESRRWASLEYAHVRDLSDIIDATRPRDRDLGVLAARGRQDADEFEAWYEEFIRTTRINAGLPLTPPPAQSQIEVDGPATHLPPREREQGRATTTPRRRTETGYRNDVWRRLRVAGGPFGTPPQLLRELGIYDGASGIYVDKARTG